MPSVRRRAPAIALEVDVNAPDWMPIDVEQYVPSSPHNLPPRRDRPVYRGYAGLSGQTLIPVDPGLPPGAAPAPAPAADATEIFDPHHYASTLEAAVTLPATANTSVLVLTEPTTRRNYLLIRNNSATAVIFISFGRDASTNSPIRLSSNQMILLDTVVIQDDMYVMSDTASSVVCFAVSTL